MSTKPVVVLNPRSAGGKTGRVESDLVAAIERALGPVDLVRTEERAHAVTLAHRAADEGRALVVAVGGDGTISEVAAGILRSSKPDTALGIVGQGTGGDFRKSVGLEHRLDRYLDAIARGTSRKVDVGRATFVSDGRPAERTFVNVLSAGMGGLVDKFVAGSSGRFGGKATYLAASVKALVASTRTKVVCTSEGEGGTETRELWTYMLAICNGSFFGAGMHIAPRASIDDGFFDVVSMDAPSKIAFVRHSQTIYEGKHLSNPDVTHFRARKITVTNAPVPNAEPLLLDVDGEPLGSLPLTVELLPRALTLRV
ncbi:MAG: diacylglycerol kinase family protein [Polyangiaceae bacterium]